MSEYRYTSQDDDKRTIIFWVTVGSVVASLCLWSIFPFFFAIAVLSLCLRGLENMDAGRPVFMPGKYSRHFQDSMHRYSSNSYGGGYWVKTKRGRY